MGDLDPGGVGVLRDQIDRNLGRSRRVVESPREPDLLQRMETSDDALPAIVGLPGVALLPQLGPRAQQRLGALGAHQGIPNDLHRPGDGPTDHNLALGLASGLACLFHGDLTSWSSYIPPAPPLESGLVKL